jgi:hypothetical protein
MPELVKKSKAILAVASLVFCGLAAADSGVSVSQQQDVEVLSSKSVAVSGHAAFNRLRARNRKAAAGQGRTAGNTVLAIAPVSSFGFHLPSAGLASSIAFSSYDLSCERSASARAPPLS